MYCNRYKAFGTNLWAFNYKFVHMRGWWWPGLDFWMAGFAFTAVLGWGPEWYDFCRV